MQGTSPLKFREGRGFPPSSGGLSCDPVAIRQGVVAERSNPEVHTANSCGHTHDGARAQARTRHHAANRATCNDAFHRRGSLPVRPDTEWSGVYPKPANGHLWSSPLRESGSACRSGSCSTFRPGGRLGPGPRYFPSAFRLPKGRTFAGSSRRISQSMGFRRFHSAARHPESTLRILCPPMTPSSDAGVRPGERTGHEAIEVHG